MSNERYPWGHLRRFNSYTEYIRKTFGGRIQKVVVDAGFTCPNRDGTIGVGGCTYCNNDSFNPSYCNPREPLDFQISKGIAFHRVRYRRARQYLVYFQPYSNTYAPLPVLKKLYQEALGYPGVKGIVIGTRPDCVDDALLEYLHELSELHYIQIEYGIESCYDETLQRINRGHSFAVGEKMIRKTADLGIKTGAHFIFGLPGETRDMMMHCASIISELPLDSVKFHQLQIVKGTLMEQEFSDHPENFVQFSLPEYMTFMADFLEQLHPSVVIERFSGEVPPRFLHHSSWGLIRYDEVLRLIEAELERRDTWQGKMTPYT
ncbi:MAG TPA: TIGR01212 family radical SAM protein [Bacteroidales bacterium]|nr:TIGR01212 family radical SAM protein [Bacteroidales bacterium]HPS50183.1 TIGR01212 family radical SAM protein [Bacteroidales bacterium]